MKVIVFLAVLGFALAAPQYDSDRDIEVRGLIEDGINKTINQILANLTDTISIDALGPIDLGDNDIISGALNATSITIKGIKNLVVPAIALDIFHMALNMTVNIGELLIDLAYWADMLLLNLVPLFGEGRMNIVLDGIDLSIAGTANLTGGLSLTNITIGITLGDATFDLNGLIDNPEFSALVSEALNDNFVTFVNKNEKVISSIISPIIEGIINSIMGSDDNDNGDNDGQLIYQYRRQ